MARRRAHGSVFRRRLREAVPGGRPRYSKTWTARVRVNGREYKRSAGRDRDTALEVLEKLIREVERQELLDEAPEQDVTFEAFTPKYLAHVRRRVTDLSYGTLSSLVPNRLGPFFDRTKLKEIRPRDVERYLGSRKAVSGPTRNRELSALSSMLEYAKSLSIVRTNVTREVKRAPEPQTPLPLVTLAEQQQLLAFVDARYRTFYLTAFETGMRLGELMRLEWRDVDFTSNRLMVRESKNKKPRMVALSGRLRTELRLARGSRVRPLHGPDLVFPGAHVGGGNLSKPWRAAFKEAAARVGHPGLRIHDTRHVCAVNLVKAGVDLPTIKAFLGHRSLVSTLRYADFADDTASVRAAQALDRLHEQSGPRGGGRAL